ncbi:hypothetical protein JCM33374_g3705 [Metschnikowia sp. JCM 33374]|nr:hypothetical protein JCM33374_g3705 [Metschnikowia sp. JCM 33374]
MPTFQDLFAETYSKVVLPLHVIALQVPSGSDNPNMMVTDYSRTRESPFVVKDDKVVFADNEVCVIRAKFDQLKHLQEAYHTRTGRSLFEAEDVAPNSDLWIDIRHKFCFVDASVAVYLNGVRFLNRATLAKRASQPFSSLWARFVHAVSGRVPIDKPLLFSVVQPCLARDEQTMLDHLPGDSTSYSTQESQQPSGLEVKSETGSGSNSPGLDDILRGQDEFRMSLPTDPSHDMASDSFLRAPAATGVFSGGASGGATAIQGSPELLTQIRMFGTQTQDETGDSIHRQTDVPDTLNETPDDSHSGSLEHHHNHQDLHSNMGYANRGQILPRALSSHRSLYSPALTEIDAVQQAGKVITLADLKKVPMIEDGRVFRVRTRIVRTVPHDLIFLCTKYFEVQNSEAICGYIKVSPLELVLSDTDEKRITNQNSVVVRVPAENVAGFFDCRHTEQLYMHMETKKAEFAKLYSSAITLELCVRYEGRGAMWVLNEVSRMSVLSNELV